MERTYWPSLISFLVVVVTIMMTSANPIGDEHQVIDSIIQSWYSIASRKWFLGTHIHTVAKCSVQWTIVFCRNVIFYKMR